VPGYLGVTAKRRHRLDNRWVELEITNLSSERGGGARTAYAAAARPDDEEIVVVLLAVGDRRLPVDEHLPRHGFSTPRNKTLGGAQLNFEEKIRLQNLSGRKQRR